jgi:methyl-accepting chemotaxis protein
MKSRSNLKNYYLNKEEDFMKWFVNLSTRAKLFVGFGVVIVFLIVVMATAQKGISRIMEFQRDIFYVEFANSVDLLRLRSDEDAIRLALITMINAAERTGKEQLHQAVKERAENIEKIFQWLMDRNRGKPDIMSKIDELNRVRLAFKETRDSQIIPLIYEGKIEDAKRLAFGIQNERFEKIKTITNELVKYADDEARLHIKESEDIAKETVNYFINIGIAAIIISMAVAVLMNRIIAKPLRNISDVAAKVASGNLAVNLQFEERGDEVGVLSKTFHQMVERLQKQTRDIAEAINVLASSSNQIVATIAQLAAGTEQTAVAVNETTTTAEEVKQAATVSNQKVKRVTEVAQNAVQVSQSGEGLVYETIDGINKIREQMEYIAETIVRLSEHNQAIGEIIASVDDLAEQSNLLSVNASIEATKAGEQGKGFLVVAQEIKSLAEQSRQATKQVRTILNDIQKATSAAVMATEKGSKSVEGVVKQSAGTGDAIKELTKSINEASQAVMQISASNQQQLIGMDQVVLAMTNIKQAAVQNAAGTKQVETTVRSLQEIGQKLRDMVRHYTI